MSGAGVSGGVVGVFSLAGNFHYQGLCCLNAGANGHHGGLVETVPGYCGGAVAGLAYLA